MATVQELLKLREGGVGQARSDVDFLLKQIRQRMQKAQTEDRQLAKNIKSGGKTALEGIKTRRDFLLAKRANPNLNIKDFILDDRTAGKYMEQGASSIASGKSPAISLKETFNPFNKNYARNLNVEKSNEMLQGLRRNVNQAIPSAQAEMLPDQKLGAMPEFGDYSNLEKAPALTETAGVQGILPEGVQRISGNTASPNVIQDAMEQARQRMGSKNTEGVNMIRERLNRMLDGSLSTSPSGVSASPIQSPGLESGTLEGAGKLGMAGKALGGVGSALSLGSGIKDIAKGKGDLSAVAKTAGGALGLASTLGLANPLLGLGFGLLSKLSQRR